MMSSEVSILKLILNNMAEHFFDEVHFFLTQASLSMKNSQFLTEISEICVLLNPNIVQALKACKEYYFLNGSYKFRDISTFANKLDLGVAIRIQIDIPMFNINNYQIVENHAVPITLQKIRAFSSFTQKYRNSHFLIKNTKNFSI